MTQVLLIIVIFVVLVASTFIIAASFGMDLQKSGKLNRFGYLSAFVIALILSLPIQLLIQQAHLCARR